MAKALADSSEYFLRHGNFDIDHLTILGPKIGVRDSNLYEIGRPLEVTSKDGKTFVKGVIYSGEGPAAQQANIFWSSLNDIRPPQRWYPSVGGQIDKLGRVVQYDPNTNSKRVLIKSTRWYNIGFSKTPVNPNVPTVSLLPFGALTKSWGNDGIDLIKAMTMGYGTDSATLSGGAALRKQSLDGSIKTYLQFRDSILKDMKAGTAGGNPSSRDILDYAVKNYGLEPDSAADYVSRLLSETREAIASTMPSMGKSKQSNILGTFGLITLGPVLGANHMAHFAAAWKNMGHTTAYLKLIKKAASEMLIGLQLTSINGAHIGGFFEPNKRHIVIEKNRFQDDTTATSTMNHETAHALDHAAGQLLGYTVHTAATHSPDSPFRVSLEKSGDGVRLNLGPIAKELLDVYRAYRNEFNRRNLLADNKNATAPPETSRSVGRPGVVGADVPRAGDASGNGVSSEIRTQSATSNTGDGVEKTKTDSAIAGDQQGTTRYSYEGPRQAERADLLAENGFRKLVHSLGDLVSIMERVEKGEKLNAGDVKTIEDTNLNACQELLAVSHSITTHMPDVFNEYAPKASAFLKRLHASTKLEEVANLLSGKEQVDGVGKGLTAMDMGVEPADAAEVIGATDGLYVGGSVNDQIPLSGVDGKPVALANTARPVRLPPLIRSPLPEAQQPVAREQLQSAIGKWITKGVDKVKDGTNFAALHLATTSDLVNMATKVMPTARKYWDALRSAQSAKLASEQDIDSVLNLASNLTKEQGDRVNKYLADSTLSGQWGYTPDHLKGSGYEPDLGLRMKFNALSPKEQEVVKRVFKHGYDSMQELRKQALYAIGEDYNPRIEEARKSGNMEEVKNLENDKLAASRTFEALSGINTDAPYAPLSRFGDFAVIGKSRRYADMEKTLREDEDLSNSERRKLAGELKDMR